MYHDARLRPAARDFDAAVFVLGSASNEDRRAHGESFRTFSSISLGK